MTKQQAIIKLRESNSIFLYDILEAYLYPVAPSDIITPKSFSDNFAKYIEDQTAEELLYSDTVDIQGAYRKLNRDLTELFCK